MFVFFIVTNALYAAVTDNPQIPVPPIRTKLGTMPGMDELPVCADLPDPMVMNNGRRVITTEQWQRRPG